MAVSKKFATDSVNITKKNTTQKIYYALRPLILFENCAGLFRFCMKNGQLQSPNWAMNMYSVILLTLIFIGFGFSLRLPTSYSGQDHLRDIIDQVPLVVILVHYSTAMITTSCFFSKSNIDVITTIAEVDDQLLIEAHDGDLYKKDRIKHIKYLIALCVSQTIIVIIDIVTQNTQFLEAQRRADTIFYTVFLIEKLEILAFCMFIEMVKCRLTLINSYIYKFLEDNGSDKTCVFTLCDKISPSKEVNIIGRPSENNMKIRDLAMVYDKLATICSLINKVYNFQIFMSLVSTFVYIIITIWTSLYYYRSSENKSGPLLSISIWCFTTILVVAGMCFVCEKLLFVRNNTKILVNQLIMDYDLAKTMRVQAKAFMELIEAWPLQVLIYDMFSVDITLMLKFISVATTYLIVIIQISHFIN